MIRSITRAMNDGRAENPLVEINSQSRDKRAGGSKVCGYTAFSGLGNDSGGDCRDEQALSQRLKTHYLRNRRLRLRGRLVLDEEALEEIGRDVPDWCSPISGYRACREPRAFDLLKQPYPGRLALCADRIRR